LFVRFVPKATFTNQDVIRRFVPRTGLSKLKLHAEIFTGPAMSGRTNWEM